MQTTGIVSASSAASAYTRKIAGFTPTAINGRPDLDFAAAVQKVSPQAQAKAKSTATDFEAMFINSMFAQMTSGLKGDGPFGDTVGTGVWRSMLTEQFSRNFAKSGGVGIASDVYRTLILQQAKTASSAAASTAAVGNAVVNDANSKSSSQ
jgi:Rod binding domain-containing protein